jgi:formylmethanofuran dehydrogenase subunit B
LTQTVLNQIWFKDILETRIQSAICPGCACLCDDIDITVVDGKVQQADNICLWGAGKFLSQKRFHPKKERRRLSEPQIKRRGLWQSVTYEAALARAGEILAQARRPLIYGLTNAGVNAQEAALALARRARGRLEPADLAFKAPYYQAVAKYGLYWASLEVIRDEADSVLFWGANPLHSCPRHVVRYSVFARGKFTERGFEERRTAAVDIHRTELAELVKFFVPLEPGQELVLLQGLLAALKGCTPPKLKGMRRLVAFFQEASYSVIFFGRGVCYGPAREVLDGLAELAARLNDRIPCILFPLSADFNSVGLYHLLLRELGSPLAPDFGAPSGLSLHAEPAALASVDALVVVGADLFWFLSETEISDLKKRRVPVVALSPFANRTTGNADVVIPVPLAGLETPEIAFRMDGLPLFLPELVHSPLRPDSQVLRDLAATL